MGTMERILRLMAEKKASDVYLSAHAPAQIRISVPFSAPTVNISLSSEERNSTGSSAIQST